MKLQYLEDRKKGGLTGFGMIWEKGTAAVNTKYRLTADGREFPVQSEISAYWPDGSVKWSRHSANLPEGASRIELEPAGEAWEEKRPDMPLSVAAEAYGWRIDTGVLSVFVQSEGSDLLRDAAVGGSVRIAKAGLILKLEEKESASEDGEEIRRRRQLRGMTKGAVLEESGPLQCVVRIEGIHVRKETGEEKFPYIARLFFASGEERIRIQHTFLYDGEEAKDFMAGIGLEAECPAEGRTCNRHVKIGGDSGYFHETGKLLTSWRPRLDPEIYRNQMKGNLISEELFADPALSEAAEDMTEWSSFRILQQSADSYVIKKRTGKEECCRITAVSGKRASGMAAFSGETGGVAVGIRHFWQKYPSAIWIDGLDQPSVKLTAWIWPPECEAMDYRHYDTVSHPQSYYEGFAEFGASACGIANTNELVLAPFAGNIPSDERLGDWNLSLQKPPVLTAAPEYYHEVRAFGEWSLPSRDTAVKAWFESKMDEAVEFYRHEIEARGWYGLYDYGDVMHTYDSVRHCWKYDMGGYAWQNTELVPTLWLWYAFLRSGRSDIYELAEAMSRHTADVDVYHFGPYKGLGSRHNVRHWGCPCKEARIGMAGHHRVFYYLTGDKRIGDVMDETADADFATLAIDPLRYFYDKAEMIYPTHARSGPDWSSYTSNWMTAWERHQDVRYRDKILTGIADLKRAPFKLISGSDFEYDPESSHLRYIGENSGGGSHLMICMGGPQVWIELAGLLKDEEWEKMLADLGVFYYDTPEVRAEKSNGLIGRGGYAFPYMAAGIAAYGARYYNNEELGSRVWEVLFKALEKKGFTSRNAGAYVNRNPLYEIEWLSTNFTAQWCLNAIVCLELAKDYLPDRMPE